MNQALQQFSFGFEQPIATNFPLASDMILHLLITKPSGSVTLRLMTPDTFNIPDGTLTWTVLEGELDEQGAYSLQLCDTTTGRKIFSQIVGFYVGPNLAVVPDS